MALLQTELNWDAETDVVTSGDVIAVVHTVLYPGMWQLVGGTYTSTFRIYLLFSSSDREVEAEYSSETFVTFEPKFNAAHSREALTL
jgi:hypothetical protein